MCFQQLLWLFNNDTCCETKHDFDFSQVNEAMKKRKKRCLNQREENGMTNKRLHDIIYTRVVTNLQQTCSNAVPTTCQQDVFALLVPSLLTTCYKVVELNRLVTSCSNNFLSSFNSTICQQVVSDNLVAT